jgi:bifunctional non-homologous end joining protein LigD
MHLRGAEPVERARRATPVTYIVFDLLAVDGQVTTGLPLTERLALLDELFVPGASAIRSDVINGSGKALYAAAEAKGLEGVVAKRASSTYLDGRRSPDWRKIKVRRTAEVVVGGWLESSRGGRDLGSLLVGAHGNSGGEEGLRYLGRVGTGFDTAERARLLDLLEEVENPPFVDQAAKRSEPVHWVNPTTVIEVEYAETSQNGRLRAPSYRGTRDDVPAGSVGREGIA